MAKYDYTRNLKTTMPFPVGIDKIQDKEWHFRWLHKKGEYHMAEMIVNKYKIVTEDMFPQVKDDPRKDAKGHVVHGDLVLAVCPFKQWQARLDAEAHESQRRVASIKRSYHMQTRREGVGTFEEDRPGPPK